MSRVLTGTDKSGSFRFYLAVTTDMVEKARQIHDLTPLACAGLGRVLTGAGLMSMMLKNDSDRLTVQFKGDGPAGQILACGYGDGRIRGYIANPQVELPLKDKGKLDVGGSLGIGELTVIKDMGLKEPYSGTIALVDGEIADDLTAYYYISEQQNTSIALGVKVGRERNVIAAGGMFIQMLPGAEDAVIDALEEMIGNLPPITTVVEQALLACGGMPQNEDDVLKHMMQQIFGSLPAEYAPQILELRDVKWECDCSRERMAAALMTIGASELETILKEDGQAELGCQFCRSKYRFNAEELQEIINKAKGK